MKKVWQVLVILLLSVSQLVSFVDASILLTATTEILELETSAAVSTDFKCEFADHTTTTFTPGTSQGNISTATTTTIVSAPAASTQRQIKECRVYNRSTTTAQIVTFKFDVSATERLLYKATLAAGESVQYTEERGFVAIDASGNIRIRATDTNGFTGRVESYSKAGTAKDSAGYWYAYGKDAGYPGAYALGTPGLNGFNTGCSVATQATNPVGAAQIGSNYLINPSTGGYYLTQANIAESVAELTQLIDPLWYNTGIVVTTTTAQAITMPGAIPARDTNGSTNGDGVYAALLTTTANTNAAVISNTTISYTDSNGNAGNTGTFQALVGWQAPATPVIGTWMRFQLAAGDRGIRSVQSITLGTSYGAGALSLVLYRPLATLANPVANVGSVLNPVPNITAPGIRLWNDTCVWALSVGSASASNLAGTYTIMER